jgi:hypothetical protein
MNSETAPSVVVGESGHRHPRLLKLRPFKNKKPTSGSSYGRFLLVAVAVLVVAGLIWLVDEKVIHHNVVIGQTVITPAQVKELTTEVTNYTRATGNHYGQPAKKVAQDDLVLNAALKDQAAKHHVQVTQAEIDFAQASQYAQYKTKAAYQQHLRAVGIANLVNITAENNLYETKLENVLILQKSVFVISINYDTPYFNTASDPAALRAQATKTMQTKFLPLFRQGKSEAQIAAQADLNYTQTNPNVSASVYFTGMPVAAFYVRGCTTATPCFNDVKTGTFAKLPGIVSTASELNKLTKVGQYSGVITTQAGFIGIIQLSSQTPGAYSSWDQFTKAYEQKYAPQFAVLTAGPVRGGVGGL